MPKRQKPPKIDGEIFTLSSGAQVRFNKIAPGIQQGILQRAQTQMMATGMISSLRNLKKPSDDDMGLALMQTLGADGIEKLTSITTERNTDLLMWGVTLVSDMPEDTRWLRNLKKSRSVNIDWGLYDINDPEDVQQLYVRYIAFGTEEDWALFYKHTDVQDILQDQLAIPEDEEEQVEDNDQSEAIEVPF